MANLSLFVPILLLAIFAKEGESVRCFVCSSDTNPQCSDPLYPTGRSNNFYQFPLENCDNIAGATYPYLTASKSACMKLKKYINGELVTIRGCTWKRSDDHSNACPMSTNGGVNDMISFCQTCEYDGCNGDATIGTTTDVKQPI